MCKVSDKIKLCSCNDQAGLFSHYWVLHRYVGGTGVTIIGECLMPATIDPAINQLNEELLLRLLNTGNIFDADIKIADKDRLGISFKVGSMMGHLTYGFAYLNGKWRPEPYELFEWMSRYEEKATGTIENGLERKQYPEERP